MDGPRTLLIAEILEKLSHASTTEERCAILRSAGEDARVRFPLELQQLEALVRKYRPWTLLATLSFFDLSYLPELGRRFVEGPSVEQYHLEIMQALILAHPLPNFGSGVLDGSDLQEIRDRAVSVCSLFHAREFANISPELSSAALQKLQFTAILRGHTAGVRNWGYEHQLVNALEGLYAPLDDAVQAKFGVRMCDLAKMFIAIIRRIEAHMRSHFAALQRIVQQQTLQFAVSTYLEQFKEKHFSFAEFEEQARQAQASLEDIKAALVLRSTAFLHGVYAISVEDILAAYPKKIASKHILEALAFWSMRLGDLAQKQQEHFFLHNPVWKKPLMLATTRVIFWPIPSLFFGFCFEMFEDFVSRDPALKTKLQLRRGEYLEEQVTATAARRYPQTAVFRGNSWQDPLTKETFESDVLLVFDSVAVVIECKAGHINPGARRGGASISQELQQLVHDATVQAQRFATLLQRQGSQCSFASKAGTPNDYDWTKIRQVCCVAITFERLGPLATQLPALRSLHLLPPSDCHVPTMSLSDFELLLDVLETPFQLIHYLTRRTFFECQQTLLADELDLLSFYLQNGFTNVETDGRPIMMYGASKHLDDYYLRRDYMGATKPARKLSSWCSSILEQLEKQGIQRRYEIASPLLDCSFEDQIELEGRVRALCDEVKSSQPCSLTEAQGISYPVKAADVSQVILIIALKSTAIQHCQQIIAHRVDCAFQQTSAERAVVIWLDADAGDWPFSGISLVDRPSPWSNKEG